MRSLDKTKFYIGRGLERPLPLKTVLEYKERRKHIGFYLHQKSIRCDVCKKIDHMAPSEDEVFILGDEMYIRGKNWMYIPESHKTCVEVMETCPIL